MTYSGIPVEPTVVKLSSRGDSSCCGYLLGVLADWVTDDSATTAGMGR